MIIKFNDGNTLQTVGYIYARVCIHYIYIYIQREWQTERKILFDIAINRDT